MKNPNINICLRMAFTAGGRFLAGTAICLLTRTIRSLWGLRTRAVPAGVTALRYSHSS